jgi:hypothetical protein
MGKSRRGINDSSYLIVLLATDDGVKRAAS